MAGELILIVEDNEKNLKLARDVLEFEGYRILESRTAVEGIAQADARLPQLILMDIQLPDMDGTSALRHLKAMPRTASIPVIALTAFAMKNDRERFLSEGFDSYVAKPINVKEFLAQVRQICARVRRDG